MNLVAACLPHQAAPTSPFFFCTPLTNPNAFDPFPHAAAGNCICHAASADRPEHASHGNTTRTSRASDNSRRGGCG